MTDTAPATGSAPIDPGQLAASPLFSDLPEPLLQALVAAAERVMLPGGEWLFTQGEASDAFHLLRWGRLAVWRTDADGAVHALGRIGPGECVGEVGLILEQSRHVGVCAVRDCELLRWDKPAFERLIGQHPAAMLRLTRHALQRYVEQETEPVDEGARSVAVLPLTPAVDAEAFARQLADALGPPGAVRRVHASEAGDRGPGWFSVLEREVGGLVYVGGEDPGWRARCVRQSDDLLLLANADDEPPADLSVPEHSPGRAAPQLVLLHGGPLLPGRARRWLQACPGVQRHHHVRGPSDVARVARLLTGRATGLVLSGGGARGFAHIGALRALRERGISIDYVAGCSAGAVIGAGIAADWDESHLVGALHAAFVEDNPLSDRTLPLVAMHAGRKVSQMLRRMFGSGDIEDLPIPFFCVSSDLTDGVLHVHERGPVWLALRASSSIPGIVPPVFHQRRVLVDGGVIDNLPVDEMRKRLSGHIVAVDVGGNYRLDTRLEEASLPPWWRQLLLQWKQKRWPGIGQILWRAGMVNSAATVAHQRRLSNRLLRLELDEIELLGWKQFDRAIALGYREAARQLAGDVPQAQSVPEVDR